MGTLGEPVPVLFKDGLEKSATYSGLCGAFQNKTDHHIFHVPELVYVIHG